MAPETGAFQPSAACSATSRSMAAAMLGGNGDVRPDLHVDVGREELVGRRQHLRLALGHEMHHVQLLRRPPEDAGPDRDLLAFTHLDQVGEELLERECPGLIGLEILAVQADLLEEPPVALPKRWVYHITFMCPIRSM